MLPEGSLIILFDGNNVHISLIICQIMILHQIYFLVSVSEGSSVDYSTSVPGTSDQDTTPRKQRTNSG